MAHEPLIRGGRGPRRVASSLRTGGPDAPPRVARRSVRPDGPGRLRPRPARRARERRVRRRRAGDRHSPSRPWPRCARPSRCSSSASAEAAAPARASPRQPGSRWRPSTGAAPATRNARFLDVSYAGVTYPSYARFHVPPTGVRRDRIGGRPALTVFYRLPNGARMSYTVFSGKPVGLPRHARAGGVRGRAPDDVLHPAGPRGGDAGAVRAHMRPGRAHHPRRPAGARRRAGPRAGRLALHSVQRARRSDRGRGAAGS